MNRLATRLLLMIAYACAARVAAAKTFIVDAGGVGDFTTIQAAVDAVRADIGPDTIVVHPGDYAEHVLFTCTSNPPPVAASLLVSSSGPTVTSLLDASTSISVDIVPPWWWTIRGFELKNSFTLSNTVMPSYLRLRWEQCVFRSGVQALNRNCSNQTDFEDCDFYGPTALMLYANGVPGFLHLRFHHAPLTTQKQCGTMTYTACTFEGQPGDTLVHAITSEDTYFTGCTFDSGTLGLRSPTPSGGGVGASTFRNLAVGVDVAGPPFDYWTPFGLGDCRFEDCGQAIIGHGSPLVLAADTLVRCGPGAIVAGPNSRLSGIQVEGGTGPAVDFLTVTSSRMPFTIENSTFLGVQGIAVRVPTPASGDQPPDLWLTANSFRNGGDTAVSATVATTHVTGNVVFANEGAGIVLTLTDPAGTDTSAFNTAALNLADGLAYYGGSGGLPPKLTVTRNISAQNGGAGYRFGPGFTGRLTNNDAWQNYGGNYVGAAGDATDLVRDPLFCNLAAGDLTVSAGSPGSIYTSTGPMGALGTGCDIDLLGAPPPVAAASFRARPIPARGRIEFTLPALPGVARLDVLDAQGRRVWSAPLEWGATSVRWLGERDGAGAAEPGVYWARLTCAGAPRTTRFVWLR